ncbi:hypothetical protein DITRI_Ditri14bG0011900 [Diplodiscus trichospermus]
MVIRNDSWQFYACRQLSFAADLSPKEAEALALLQAITWARDQQLGKVIFEYDAQLVVKAVHSSMVDLTEFGTLIEGCKLILSLEQNFSVCYVKRQANEVAHSLARAARFNACPFTSYNPPNCFLGLLPLICYEH